ncbi:polymerase delta-interacting protein 3 [Nasonia vitripennis]|uniref:RRM domain-containing protein n=1 Tax=Nasonia vitripennis TaxID=7425 RepID=A0A7M7LL93_NASVI|nr:polymerase delta-interacting protein 3 [Nasonia vitripennis]
MSNDLVSLDDIIKKSKTSTSTMRGRGVGPRKPVLKNGPRTNGAAPLRPNAKPIEDARFKIIQKKRRHIADARDKLAQIAKQSDARLKLQKLRATNTKKIDSTIISRKTGRNGRMSLSTNKPLPPHAPRSLPPTFIPPPARTMGYRPPPGPESHYVNEMIMTYNDVRIPKPKESEYLQYHTKDYLMDSHHHHQAALRRTVSNDYAPAMPPPPPLFNIKPVPYDWDKPVRSSTLSRSQTVRASDHSSRPRDYKVIPRSGLITKAQSPPPYRNEWTFGSKSRTIIPDNSIEAKYYTMRNHREIGVKSRLDSPPPKASRTASNSSRPKSSSTAAGYRIVVSNLQANVTQEDIKELFEDVGELLVSRLVRPGIAEVIYKTLKDATKAVETYHNRQLDGHPMKCLLVNPRPKTSSSTSSSSRVLTHSRSSSSYSQPSLGTVHRALFDD